MNFLRRKERGSRSDNNYNTGSHHNNTSGFNNNNNPNSGGYNSNNTGYNNNSGFNNNHGNYNNNTGPTGTAVGTGNSMAMTSSHDRHDRHDSRHGKHDRYDKHDKHEERRLRKQEKKQNKARFDVNSGNFNRRPSFGQWLKFMWLDILTMAALGAVGLGVYNADPAPSRSFPITFSDNEVVYPEFAYPLRSEIVPIWEAALLASLIPIAVILLMQIRIKSFWDVNNAIVGLLYSLITAAVFQVFIKWLIGGLRPHFLYVCAPDMSRVMQNGLVQGQGFRQIMFQRDVCTGDRNQINDSLESMPSGHSTAAFAGFIYLYFYLNAKLKVFSNYHPAMWKLVATYAPVLGACLIAGSLTIDKYHNWYDCFAGAVIGTVMAISAYRMVYASVWDFRFNHIPLTRHTPFSYGAGEAGAGGFETAVFTRKAGWGYEEAYGGAPFDAAHHLRGQQAGFNNAIHNDNGQKGGLGHKLGHHNERDVGHNNTTGLGTNDRGLGNNQSTLGHNSTTTGHDAIGLGHNERGVDRNDGGIGYNQSGLGHNETGVGHHNRGIGHNETGLGHHNNQGLGNTQTGLGHNHGLGHNNQGLGNETGLGHHNQGLGQDQTYGPNQAGGVYDQTGTGRGRLTDRDNGGYNTGTGMGHDPLHRNHRDGDVEYNAANNMQGGRVDDQGASRYKIHSRSLERKALNRNSQGAVV